eukprot:TRINITY_DN13265_c0_g1_i1.p1 TRINITY_DN13265_c0_g1~~TRINITY_DN13265_c0_g1_i1.p1  ORF type:complete len:487 (+),score=86.38 TRINITY_DN13265_c0_g1_i1:40-1500(+)
MSYQDDRSGRGGDGGLQYNVQDGYTNVGVNHNANQTNEYQNDFASEKEPVLSANFVDNDSLLEDGHRHGESSSFFASYNIICTVVGAGLINLPAGLMQSGWIGLAFLIVLGLMSCYTGIILIRCLHPPGRRRLYTYGDIGEATYGTFGRWFVNIQMHMVLTGVATIYLVLAGSNFQEYLVNLPTKSGYYNWWPDVHISVCIIIIAAVVWLHVWLRTLHEVGALSAFNVCVAVFIFVLVIVEVFLNPPDYTPSHTILNTSHHYTALGGAFSAFAFAYGVHPVLPTVYESMKKPQQYTKMLMLTFAFILCLYIPLSTIGYWAYGDQTQSPIYGNICSYGDTEGTDLCSFSERIAIYAGVAGITLHVMFSYAVVINPTELALERAFRIDDMSPTWTKIMSVLLRTCLVGLTAILACLVPDFGDLLGLVSSTTSTFTVFILPCVFYWVLFGPQLSPLTKLWLVSICSCAVVGGVIGTIQSGESLWQYAFN